jgi:Zn-dependent protease with chaperone function
VARHQYQHLKKWAAFASIVFVSTLPALLISSIFNLPLVYAFCYHAFILITSFIIKLKQKNYFRYQFIPNERNINIKSSKEKEIYSILEDLAIKANVPMPRLHVIKSKSNGSHIDAEATGWPYTPTIVITEETIEMYNNGFAKETLKAVLAHELSHIKNNDCFYKIVCSLFKKATSLHFMISLFATVLLAVLFGINLVVVGAQGIILNELLFWSMAPIITTVMMKAIDLATNLSIKLFRRSFEMIADLNAVELVQNPKAVAYMNFEIDFHELRWGAICRENNKTGIKERIFIDEAIPKLKRIHRHCSKKLSKRNLLGEVQLKVLNSNKKDTITPFLTNTKQSWQRLFLTHPTNEYRYQVIKDSYPTKFKPG